MKAVPNEGFFLAGRSYEIVSLVEDKLHTSWFIARGIRFASLYKGIRPPSIYQRKIQFEFDVLDTY